MSRTKKSSSKKMSRIVLAVCGAVSILAFPAAAGGEVSISTGVEVMSKYVWRGQLLTDDPVIQPSVTLGRGGLSFNTWASIDTTDINENGDERYNIQEVDYTLSYAWSLTEMVDMEAGAIWYAFPSAPDTQEVYGGLTFSSPFVTPSINVYYDVDEVDGFYAGVGVSRTVPLTETLALNLSASQGWGDSSYDEAYFGVEQSGLNDLSLGAGLSYKPNDMTTFSASVQYTELIDSEVENAVNAAGDSDNLVVGVGLEIAF